MKKDAVILVVVMVLLFMGCADAVPYEVMTTESPDGFWWGLWHGMTVPFSFIGSLFDSDIAIYSVNNNGGWYDFGYWLGVGGLSGWIGRSSSS